MKTKLKPLAVGMFLTAAINCFGQTGSIVQFSGYYEAFYGAFEKSGLATVTVTRYEGTNAFSVDYATSDGTATAGLDYTARTGTLSFGENEWEKTFTVPILDDNLTEGVETVKLTLKNPTGQVALGQPSEAILWIVDDEPGATLLDSTFAPRVDSGVTAIAVRADGKILIGGHWHPIAA